MISRPLSSAVIIELAGKTRIVLDVKGHVELVDFLVKGFKELFRPVLIDIDMACTAGAGAAAFRLDVEPPIANDFHDAEAFEGFQRMAFAVLIGDVDIEGL